MNCVILQQKDVSMKKNLLFFIMPLLLTLSLNAKKDKVFAAIRKGDVKEFRHAVRRIKDLKEKDIAELIAYTEDFITYHREKRSILKSGRDFVRVASGAGICLAGLYCSWFVFPNRFRHLHGSSAKIANAILTGSICGASGIWAYRGLACPYAQSMVVKGQEILKYLQNLRDSDKPAAGVELDASDVQGVNEFETSAEGTEQETTDMQSFRSQMPVINAELERVAAQDFKESDSVGAVEPETTDPENFRSHMPVVGTELENFNAYELFGGDADQTDAKPEEN